MITYAQYLQQGGGIQDQVAQLVQAAMGGDSQAQSQIKQIMQAAQQGDPKAQQLAELIQQIAQQLQGQAESEETPAMKNGGRIASFQTGGIPKMQTRATGNIIKQSNNPFNQYVVYGKNTVDSIAQNYETPEVPSGLLREVVDFTDEQPVTKQYWIDEDGKYHGPDTSYIAPFEPEVKEWEFPVKQSMTTTNGWSLIPEGQRDKSVKRSQEGGNAALAKGGKTPCPCTLQRRGGKVVEVDCNGNVIKRKCGGKTKK